MQNNKSNIHAYFIVFTVRKIQNYPLFTVWDIFKLLCKNLKTINKLM